MSRACEWLCFSSTTGARHQSLFQSTAQGIISLIADRESDFSQERFVAPISRYSIIFGKILGESGVAFVQGVPILVLGLLLGVSLSLVQVLGLIVVGAIVCLFGGAFGVMTLSNLNDQRTGEPGCAVHHAATVVPVRRVRARQAAAAAAGGAVLHLTYALRRGPDSRHLLPRHARLLEGRDGPDGS